MTVSPALIVLLGTLLLTGSPANAFAQDGPEPAADASIASGMDQIQTPLSPLDTSSPRATLASALTLQNKLSRAFSAYQAEKTQVNRRRFTGPMAKARQLFDLRDVAPAQQLEVGGASIAYLSDILNRLPPEVDALLPGGPEFDADAEDAPDRVRVPGTAIELVRIDDGPQSGAYLFSADTVRQLPRFHKQMIDEPLRRDAAVPNWRTAQIRWSSPLFPAALVDRIPESLHLYILGTPAWKALLMLVLLAAVLGLTRGWWRFTRPWRRERSAVTGYAMRLSVPVLLALLISGLRWFEREVNLSGPFAEIMQVVMVFGLYIAAAWALWNLCFLVVEGIISSPRIPDEGYDAHLLRLMARIAAVLAVGAIIAYGLQAIGLPVLGLIAGLGIGGIALALAAQSTVENLFGGINVFADRPFRVGDSIAYGGETGTVEHVGPRSSRIRGLNGALTTVPNADLAKMHITNYSTRKKYWFQHTLGLRYETTREQLAWFLEQLRNRLAEHALVEKDGDMPMVRVSALGASSIDITIWAYVLTGDDHEFMQAQEELLLMIMRLADEAGIGFAFPSRTTYINLDEVPSLAARVAAGRRSHSADDCSG